MTTPEPTTAQRVPALPIAPAETPLSGTHAWLTENPHPGFAASVTEGYPSLLAGNLLNAQGNFDCLHESGVRSRSWNGYAYAGNSPLVNIDPSGACTVVNGQYQPDSGNPCPSSPTSSITVTEGGPDDLLLLAVKIFFATARAVQQTQQALTPVVNAISDFRHSSSCTGSLVSAGRAVGGLAVGGYSAVAGFGVGGFVGLPSGPGAAATAVGGATLFGGLGTTLGSYAGGGLGGVAAGILCSSSTAGQTGGSGEPGAGNLKRLSPSEINKLKTAGEDAEQIKKEIVGAGGSKYDLFKTESGDIVVKLKNGTGEAQPTGLNIRNF